MCSPEARKSGCAGFSIAPGHTKIHIIPSGLRARGISDLPKKAIII